MIIMRHRFLPHAAILFPYYLDLWAGAFTRICCSTC